MSRKDCKVMFDIDGVLRNFSHGWRYKWLKEFGKMPPRPSYWSFLEDWGEVNGFTVEETRKLLFVTWGREIMRTSPIIHGAKETLDKINKMCYTIIATHQSTNETKLGTLEWIAKHDIVVDEIVFCEDKSTVVADFYIDDRQETLQRLVDLRISPYDYYVVGMKQKWNNPSEIDGVITISDIREYEEIVRYNR